MTVKTIVCLTHASTQTDWKILQQGLVSAWSVHDSITASAMPRHYHAIIDCLRTVCRDLSNGDGKGCDGLSVCDRLWWMPARRMPLPWSLP